MKKIQFVFLAILFSACSFKPADSSDVSMKFRFDGSELQGSPLTLPGERSHQIFASITAPQSLSSFDCFAVNIMGDGIAPFIPGNYKVDMGRLIGGDHCASYPGVNSIMVDSFFQKDVELRVPSGAARYIQILGFPRSDMGCRADKTWVSVVSEGADTATFIAGHFGGLFEVGSAVRDLFHDGEVVVPNKYDPNHPRDLLDCIIGKTPKDISGLQLMYSADTFEDTTSDGNAIALNWPNGVLSTGPSPVLTSASNSALFYMNAGPNNTPVVRLSSGASNVFYGQPSSGSLSNLTGLTIFAVAKTTALTTAQSFFTITNNSGGTFSAGVDNFIKLGTTSGGNPVFTVSSSAVTGTATSSGSVASQFYLLTAFWDSNIVSLHVNNGIGPTIGAAVVPSTTLDGGILSIGAEYNANYWTGDVAEVLFYNRVLSVDERFQIKTYLTKKYGIPGN